MFKKKCPKCGEKINKESNFCSNCGYNIKREEEERDYGFLGKDDLFSPDIGMKMPFGFNRLFNSLIKQLDGQFKQLDKEIGKETSQKKTKPGIMSKGFSINISTASGKQPEIKIKGFGPGVSNLETPIKVQTSEPKKLPKTEISDAKAKKLSKLPKEEALTTVRRLSNKIIYEIDLPDVKKLADVIINQLENSIEIKAFSKNKAYFKLLPINLPILNYKLEKGKLILELKQD